MNIRILQVDSREAVCHVTLCVYVHICMYIFYILAYIYMYTYELRYINIYAINYSENNLSQKVILHYVLQ